MGVPRGDLFDPGVGVADRLESCGGVFGFLPDFAGEGVWVVGEEEGDFGGASLVVGVVDGVSQLVGVVHLVSLCGRRGRGW